jgi:DNA mismatch repair ATPase MutS
VFAVHAIPSWFLFFPAGTFIGLMVYHERLRRAWDRAKRAVGFYERGIDRLEDRWQKKGNPGTEYARSGHLYSTDLDILGEGSLFELLCTVRTRAGEETLARWLCSPAPRSEILRRQEAVEELRNNLDLREDLALLAPTIRAEVDPEFMSAWAKAPSRMNSKPARVFAAVLVGALLVSLVYSFVVPGSALIVLGVLTIEALFGLLYRNRVREILGTTRSPNLSEISLAVNEPVRELHVLGSALQRMEKETYTSERLRELQTNLGREGRRPSQDIARLVKLVAYLDQRRNEFFAIISITLLWATQFSFAIEAWRLRHGPEIESWLKNFGEFEALCALAGYAYEHPGDPFPEIVDGEVLLEADELRHPLIVPTACVPNTIALGKGLQLLLVSGSNMSGKSTLLRTVGINAVLAMAGGPVRAKRMKLSVLSIGATLHVQDSLQAGISRFYAEIQKLHDTMELNSGPLPVLFLLDEILHGTNSHDRAIGAEAIVRGLIERGAIGLVTTHDLALARVVDALAPRAKNVHFEDHLENGRMTFDYVLHPGVVQKSNALELMRAVGLKV